MIVKDKKFFGFVFSLTCSIFDVIPHIRSIRITRYDQKEKKQINIVFPTERE